MNTNKYRFLKLNKHNHKISLETNLPKKRKSRPAIFFDRDGVIIDDCHYISDPKNVKIMPGVKKLLNISSEAGWLNIVVTNQSGISRGILNWHHYEQVSMKMINLCGSKSPIHAIFANNNLPQENSKENNWRKPSPKMILIAANEFNINLDQSILIGDRLTDLISAKNAGISKIIHVLTGHGLKEQDLVIEYFKNYSKEINLETLVNLNHIDLKFLFNI